ncbi:cell wall-binding repeat-containing protein [Kineococcus sp. LSe6-4]|uniref:Cell wall-binding repeat-containing protein n=1 Tax=Kineococcus halophytocola TaxID=3234027 RepID=A0ABV4H409_9ACTN
MATSAVEVRRPELNDNIVEGSGVVMDRKRRTRATKRLGAGIALLVGLSTAGATAAVAAPGFDPGAAAARTGGADRYATAALTATKNWSSARSVIVVNGAGNGIDALAASYLAGVKDAPVLLTETNRVPEATAQAIAQLNPSEVIVLGDANSVSAQTFTQLTAGRTTSERIAGVDRYDTAAKVAAAALAARPAGSAKPTSVFLARGDVYGTAVAADALAASPVAFRAKVPILLTATGSLPTVTRDALASNGFQNVYAVGNANAVSDTVVQQATTAAGGASQRLAGADRTLTAAAIANSAVAANAGFNKVGVAIANGFRIDALVAGPAAGRSGFPLLLTESATSLGAGTDQYLKNNAATLTLASVYGDSTSIAPAAVETARSSAGGSSTPSNPAPTSPVAPVSGLVTDNGTGAGTVSVAVVTAVGGTTLQVFESRDGGPYTEVTGRGIQTQYSSVGGSVTFDRPTTPGVYSYQVRSGLTTQVSAPTGASGAVTVLPGVVGGATVTNNAGTITVTPTSLPAGASLVVSERLGSGVAAVVSTGTRAYAVNSGTGAVSFTAPTTPGVYTYSVQTSQNGQTSSSVTAAPTIPIAPVAPASASASLSARTVTVTVAGVPAGSTARVEESWNGAGFNPVALNGRNYVDNAGTITFDAPAVAGTYTYRVSSTQNGQTSAPTSAPENIVRTAPSLTSATIDGRELTLVFDADLDQAGNAPDGSDFGIYVDGASSIGGLATAWGGDAKTLVITVPMGSEVGSGQMVTTTYGGDSLLIGVNGVLVAPIDKAPVTNVTQ